MAAENTDLYAIRQLPESQLPPRKLAGVLLYKSPSRGWEGYKGLDETLKIAITVAEDHKYESGLQGLKEQYGSAEIIPQLKSLRAVLKVLAHNGTEALNFQDKETLGRGRIIIGRLIKQSGGLQEHNRKAIQHKSLTENAIETVAEEDLAVAVVDIAENRPVAAAQKEYSQSAQFAGYLKDVQDALSTICRDAGISERQERQI